jgi:hypothetical protein
MLTMKIKESQLRINASDVYNALCTGLRKAGKEQSVFTLESLLRTHEDEWKEVWEWTLRDLRIK